MGSPPRLLGFGVEIWAVVETARKRDAKRFPSRGAWPVHERFRVAGHVTMG